MQSVGEPMRTMKKETISLSVYRRLLRRYVRGLVMFGCFMLLLVPVVSAGPAAASTPGDATDNTQVAEPLPASESTDPMSGISQQRLYGLSSLRGAPGAKRGLE